MKHLVEAERRLGRPIGGLVGTFRRNDGIYEARLVPAYAGEDRTVIFVRRPSFKQRLLSLAGFQQQHDGEIIWPTPRVVEEAMGS